MDVVTLRRGLSGQVMIALGAMETMNILGLIVSAKGSAAIRNIFSIYPLLLKHV